MSDVNVTVIENGVQVTIANSGQPGAKGEPGAYVESAAFNGDDIDFILSDESVVTLPDAKIELKGDQGLKGDKGDPGTPVNHDDLLNIHQAGAGITEGHISDQSQSITGLKTFLNAIKAIGNSIFGEAATNYSEFESDGTLKFNGAATVWNDIILSTSNLRPGQTPPTFAPFMNGIYGFRFDAGSADEVHGAFEIPHDYKEGSNLTVHVHYSPTTTNTGNIVFGFEHSHANDAAVFPASSAPTNTPIAASGVINKLARVNIVELSGAGYKIGDIIAFRFFRQNGGTDTFTGNVFVHSIGIHYECDTVGSRQITSK